MAHYDPQMSKEIKRRSAEKRRRRRALQIRFGIILVTLTVLGAWALLFMR